MAEENVVSRIRYLPIYDKAAPPPYSRINPSIIAQDRKLSASLGNLPTHSTVTSCSYTDVRDMCSRNARRASRESSGLSYEIQLMSSGKLRGICEEKVSSRTEEIVEPSLPMSEKSSFQSDFNTTIDFCATCGNIFNLADEIIEAAGKQFHCGCFVCYCCGMNLCHQSFTVDINNNIYCISDFIRTYAPKCSACCMSIQSTDSLTPNRVVTESDSFHLHCFSCQMCGKNCSQSTIPFCYKIGQHLICIECFSLTQSGLLGPHSRDTFTPSTRFHFWTAAVPQPLQFAARSRKVMKPRERRPEVELKPIPQKDSLQDSRILLPQRVKPIRRKHRTETKSSSSKLRHHQQQQQQQLQQQHQHQQHQGLIKEQPANVGLRLGNRPQTIDNHATSDNYANSNKTLKDSMERFNQNLVVSDKYDRSPWQQLGDQSMCETGRYPHDWSESSSAQDTSCDEYSSDVDAQSQINSNASCSSIDSGLSSYLGSQAPSDTSASSPRAGVPRRRSSDRFASSSDFDVISVDRLSTIYDNQLSNSDRSATPTEFNVFDADASGLTSTLTHSSSGKVAQIVNEELNQSMGLLEVSQSADIRSDSTSKKPVPETGSHKGHTSFSSVPSSTVSPTQLSSFSVSNPSASKSPSSPSCTKSSSSSVLGESSINSSSLLIYAPFEQKRSSEAVQYIINHTHVTTSTTLSTRYSERSPVVKSIALPLDDPCTTSAVHTTSSNSTSSGSSSSGLSVGSVREITDCRQSITRDSMSVSSSTCDVRDNREENLPLRRIPIKVEPKSIEQKNCPAVNSGLPQKLKPDDNIDADSKYRSIEQAYKEMGYKITFL